MVHTVEETDQKKKTNQSANIEHPRREMNRSEANLQEINGWYTLLKKRFRRRRPTNQRIANLKMRSKPARDQEE